MSDGGRLSVLSFLFPVLRVRPILVSRAHDSDVVTNSEVLMLSLRVALLCSIVTKTTMKLCERLGVESTQMCLKEYV